jgi:hypothetical protein
MQDVNWGVFSAKFNGHEQSTFQWLCYLLFCLEFNQPLGISRYENHAGIETDPIKVGEELVGWQAKFYTTRLSEHTKELENAITTTKTRHPKLTKIIFYTNKDFGQDKKKTDPPYKLAVEKHARSKGVTVQWKTASFFESPFVTKDNAVLAKHFFSPDKSIIDLMGGLHDHSSAVLQPIKSQISFNGQSMKIERGVIATLLRESLKTPQPVILSGNGGVGKTAVIKDFFDLMQPEMPLFIFKATEFSSASSASALFNSYGFGMADFAGTYDDIDEKCIVIDSAEKLADIDDLDVFRQFLTLSLTSGWKIVFTTRRSYLDDLKNMLVGVYSVSFEAFDIDNLTHSELSNLSQQFGFDLPNDSRLVELIGNPFYLNEYLQNYSTLKQDVSYAEFKTTLWDKQIAKSYYKKDNMHVRREDCFIELAKRRANGGNFYVKADDLDQPVLGKLVVDEIVGHDREARGYFIAHDIYEEWALEKIIQAEFIGHDDVKDFYTALGTSLPVRRAFRHWLTDKLLADKDKVKTLIESTIANKEVPSHWQDEVYVAILLSEHSKVFFDMFERELIINNAELLIRATFLLRIACKEVDIEWLKKLGVANIDGVGIKTVFTKPKGSGWAYIIDFINHHKDKLEVKSLYAILGVLEDWNSKFKQGDTTKSAGQIALFYYEKAAEDGGFGYRARDLGERLVKTILNASSELKEELGSIIDEVVAKKQISHRDKYNELAEGMLGSMVDSFEVASAMPEKLIELAGIYWPKEEKEDNEYGFSSGLDMDEYFGLSSHNREYYPSSAYQTPTLQLLRVAPDRTLEFILDLTNTATIHYANSSLSENELEKVEVIIDENTTTKQYISDRLWEMYRGTHVCPNLLESTHMALEKWLLESGKLETADKLEQYCLQLLRNTNSASITAIVTSIVLAYPDKLFNVAIILFKTKEFFIYDTHRFTKDRSHKSTLEMFRDKYPSGNNWLYQDERIKACDDSHRTQRLEGIVLKHQVFREEAVSEDEAERRRKVIEGILDNYYAQLPDEATETDDDRTWRLYLSRMDRRKMSIETEEKDGQMLISFKPEIDATLKKYSEDSLRQSEEVFKHTSLNLWAHYRWERDEEKYKPYEQYENNPQLVIIEVKQILEELKVSKAPFDQAIPSYACAVLVRDYSSQLKPAEKKFCKQVLIDYAGLYLNSEADPQISDGVEPAIDTLPLLLDGKKKNDEIIKVLLLLTLLNDNPMGMDQYVFDYAMRAILHKMWKVSFKDAHSLFLGYLLMRPKYELIRERIRQENIKKGKYRTTYPQITEALFEAYEADFENIVANKINYADLPDFSKVDLHILEVAFDLLPYRIDDLDHKKFLATVLPLFSQKLAESHTSRNEYTLGRRFFEKFANLVLTSQEQDIKAYLQPFIDGFTSSQNMADFFAEFVSAEDRIHQYEEFWITWQLFYPAFTKLCRDQPDHHRTKSVVYNYLLAWPYWKDTAKAWSSLKDREKSFFKKVAAETAGHPAVLYSLAKILNDIGSDFLDDGVLWISDMLEHNPDLAVNELETNTVYYLENLTRRFVLGNRHKVKTSPALKKRMLIILDFLIQKGSVVAYLTREDIL